jgi:hypothetical protein
MCDLPDPRNLLSTDGQDEPYNLHDSPMQTMPTDFSRALHPAPCDNPSIPTAALLHPHTGSAAMVSTVAMPTSPSVISGLPLFPYNGHPPLPSLGAALHSKFRSTTSPSHAWRPSAPPGLGWASAAARPWHPADQGEWWWQRGCALVMEVAAEVAAAGGGARAQAILAATLGPDGSLVMPPPLTIPPPGRPLSM